MNTKRWYIVVEAVFFLFLAFASTWPLAINSQDHLPLGMEEVATVPLFNVWSVWWNADRAATGYKGYWDAPIFHPTKNSFSFSEPMPLTVLAAPIIWFSDNRILAYNTLIILSIWLNGWIACRLLQNIRLHLTVAWLGGAMFALLPLIHSWLGVLQLIPIFGILLTILGLYRFNQQPTPIRGTILGASFALTYLMCSYYGLFLAVPLFLSSGWLLGKRLLQLKMWASLLPGMLICLLLCLPVVTAQQHLSSDNGMVHNITYLAELSADTKDYLVSPWSQLFEIESLMPPGNSNAFKLCPGFLKLGMALVGLFWGVTSLRHRQWTLFCLSMALLSFVLSLGPLFQVGGVRPYLFLIEYLPGFAQARNVFRFAIIVHIMISLLAILGIEAGVIAIYRYINSTKIRKILNITIITVGIVMVTEVLPDSQQLYKVPDFKINQLWIEWLDTQTPKDTIVVCIPFPLKPDVKSYEQEALWMYWQTFHRRRVINGYSGFFPQHFVNLKWPLVEFPALETTNLLINEGVQYCVVLSDSDQGEYIRRFYLHDQRIELVLRDKQAKIDIYRLNSQQ